MFNAETQCIGIDIVGYPPTMASTTERAARVSTTAVFFLTGAVVAAWSTRIPAIQEHLHLTMAALSVAILGLEGGAILGLPMGGALVTRFGSRWSLRVGFAVYPAALLGVAIAPSLAGLALTLAVMAAANSVVDVAMNAQGVELERRYGRPILSSMHAGHSAGLLAGGLAGTAAAAAAVPPIAHFAVVSVLGIIAGVTATRWLVDEPAGRGQPAFARPNRPLMLLGVVAFCGFLLDGAAYNWSAVHLHTAYHAPQALAATAFTVFTLTLALGRLTSDRLTARLGRARVVQLAGVTSAAGAAIAITAPTATTSLAGWAVFGLGLAAIAPTVLGATRRHTNTPAPVAIAAVTTIGYLGSFTGPPLIGVLAQLSTVRAALWLLVAVSILTALLARPALKPAQGRLVTASDEPAKRGQQAHFHAAHEQGQRDR
jgi:MFS family permease